MVSKRILIISVVFFTSMIYSGCQQEKASDIVEIPLEQALADVTELDMVEVLYPAITYSKHNPEYYKLKLKRFKNIPALDSLYIVSNILDRDLYHYDLFKNGLMSSDEFMEKIGEMEFDTLGVDSDSLRYSFNAVSGFQNGRHINVPDLNNNLDFSDDKSYSFPVDSIFSYQNPETLEDVPLVDLEYHTLINNKITFINRKIKFYPNPEHPYVYLIQAGFIDSIQNKYTTMLLLQDSWIGKRDLEGVSYGIQVYGPSLNEYPRVLIKPDSIGHNRFSRDNFLYTLKDTLAVKNSLYTIDSLKPKMHLYLSRIEDSTVGAAGSRIGDLMSDYTLQDLNGQGFQLLEKSDKQYVLLDFWGTWCAPCKKLTPDIKELYEQHSDKLDIIGIAVDDNLEEVASYVSKNNMNWFHAYIPMANRSAPIRKELKINAYPTFILLDNKNRIIIRGNSASFPKLRSFLENR